MAKPHPILRGYRKKLGISQAEFAKRLGIPEVTLRSIENGNRPVTPERAKEIEIATGGALTRACLRPDIFGKSVAA